MLTDKDFTFIGLTYVNPHLKYDKTYDYTKLTYNNGGCKLSRLKSKWQRFLAGFWDEVSTAELMDKSYKDKVIMLTCPKEKLLELPLSELKQLKTKILESLVAWKIPNVKNVVIYANEGE